MNAKPSFQQEIRDFLTNRCVGFEDHSESYKELDFVINFSGVIFHLDVKEKIQKYQTANWPKTMPESEMFILDDLSVRKCLAYAPNSGILIRDNLNSQYYFFSVVDLALMPKTRVNRQINKNQQGQKGKWVINLRNGIGFSSSEDAIDYLNKFIGEMDTVLFDALECYGSYVNEKVDKAGIPRKPAHWDIDVTLTK
jgi:hypothetical protein